MGRKRKREEYQVMRIPKEVYDEIVVVQSLLQLKHRRRIQIGTVLKMALDALKEKYGLDLSLIHI